jgi:DNA-binding MltR family transcriptional regulator
MAKKHKQKDREVTLPLTEQQRQLLEVASGGDIAGWSLRMLIHIANSKPQNKNPATRKPRQRKRDATASAQQPDPTPHEFIKAIEKEADRGCVLLAQSYIDQSLESLLRAKLRSMSNASETELNGLLKGGPSHPLGSFRVRVKMAQAMGLVDEVVATALCSLANVRNPFAHLPGPAELSDPRVADILTAFNEETQKEILFAGSAAAYAHQQHVGGKRDPGLTERAIFMFGAMTLYDYLLTAKGRIMAHTTD